MQTVTFQCGSCNKLMAVGAEYLGQQVRCPHCQAVVVAPAATNPVPAAANEPAAPETLSFQPPRLNEQDDIFAPPEPTDDLFGRPDAPRVELPPEEPVLAPTAEQPAPEGNGDAAFPAAPEPLTPTLTWHGSQPAARADAAALPSWMDQHTATAAGPATGAPTAEEQPHDAIPQLIRKPRDNGGWFIGLVFIPLISYALLATVAVIVLWYRLQQQPPPPPSPLETLPSFDPSDPEHATHLTLNQANQTPVFRNMDMKKATSPLPDDLIVRLGDKRKLRIGDLEVEPLRVGFDTVSVDIWGFEGKPEPCPNPSLVLHLKLRNISKDVAFQPMDRYFDRKWVAKSAPPPLTILELLGPNPPIRFFGGPAEFHPPPTLKSTGKPPEWVHGDDDTKVLKPGEEMETFVCTDGDDKAASDQIDGYHGKLLWRVHVRRGVVKLDPHRYVPVSSVIGVEFTDDDYRKSS